MYQIISKAHSSFERNRKKITVFKILLLIKEEITDPNTWVTIIKILDPKLL
jgi:hypothetical protein